MYPFYWPLLRLHTIAETVISNAAFCTCRLLLFHHQKTSDVYSSDKEVKVITGVLIIPGRRDLAPTLLCRFVLRQASALCKNLHFEFAVVVVPATFLVHSAHIRQF